MKQLFTTIILCLAFFAGAQPYEIGHTTITFNDPNRSGGFGSGGGPGRQIQTEIYYPADIAGTDVTIANGKFPVVVFGHGFAMVWDAYQNIWEELVPEGYIFAFPRTEGGFTPSHDEFGQDLALIVDEMQVQNADAMSIFYQSVTDKSGIMGHSMGGGSTMLAAANNSNIATIIVLAPAETNPSAVQAAANVDVPALVFSADEDEVTPAAAHHTPIYDNLNSACKYFINILGGGHCYYANSNFNCDFGEAASGGNITITRAEQQTIMFEYVLPWLNLYLKTMCPEASVFENDLPADNSVSFLSECTGGFPSYDLTIENINGTLWSHQVNTTYQWLDCTNNFAPVSGATDQSLTPLTIGSWAVQIGSGACIDTTNCESIVVSGISGISESNISVFPNPSNGTFSVNVPSEAAFKILNTLGQTIDQGTLKEGDNVLNLSCAAGIYLLQINRDGQAIFNKQITVR